MAPQRSSGNASPPRSTGARWTEQPGVWASVRAALPPRRDWRAELAAWAAGQPAGRRAAVLTAAGALTAFWVAFPHGDLNVWRPGAGPSVLRSALAAVGPGACAGLAYAGVAAWLLDRRRARRWAAGALVGAAYMAATAIRLAGPTPAGLWGVAAPLAAFGALAGVLLLVPSARAAARAEADAGVV